MAGACFDDDVPVGWEVEWARGGVRIAAEAEAAGTAADLLVARRRAQAARPSYFPDAPAAFVMRGFFLLYTIFFGCTLPAEEKNGCRTSVDCIDDRICVDQRCEPGGCDAPCEAACEQAPACGVDLADCTADCTREGGLLEALTPVQCKHAWDILADDEDCTAVECLDYCNDVCVAAEGCRLIDNAGACTLGCVNEGTACDGPAPTTCTAIPSAVQCFERGNC